MRPLTRSRVQNATVLLREGKSIRRVAEAVGISVFSVQKIREEDKKNIPAFKVGRPSKVSNRGKVLLARKFSTGCLRSLRQGQRQIQEAEEMHVGKSTVRRWLEHEGLRAYVCPRKPKLTKKIRAERYKFAKDHLSWTEEDWRRVMFSDETIIRRIESLGRRFYYKRPENKDLQRHQVKESLRGGGGKLLIWGCMTYYGVGDACWITGTMSSDDYLSILKDYVAATRDWYTMDRSAFIFQHDNASIHTAGIVKAFFAKSNTTVLKWPVNSPDLNPIEHLWAYIKYQLDQLPEAPTSVDELWERFQDIWASIPHDLLHELYDSMPTRIRTLYNNKGGHTKY